MGTERRYRCLACADHPVFTGRIAAHDHVRHDHADELDAHHIDALLEELPERVAEALSEDDHIAPPLICLHCDFRTTQLGGMLDTRVEGTTNQWNTGHLYREHQISAPVYRVDYISDTDRAVDAARAALAEQREAEHATLVIYSLRGADDFLTECGA